MGHYIELEWWFEILVVMEHSVFEKENLETNCALSTFDGYAMILKKENVLTVIITL